MANKNIEIFKNDKLTPVNFPELMEVLGKPSNVITIAPPPERKLTARVLKWNEQGDPTLVVTHHIIEDTWDVDFFGRSLWGLGLEVDLNHVSLDFLNDWILQNSGFIIERMRR